MRIFEFDFNNNYELVKAQGEYRIEGFGRKSWACEPSFKPLSADAKPLSSVIKMKIIKELKMRDPEIALHCGIGSQRETPARPAQTTPAVTSDSTGGQQITMDIQNVIKEAVTEGIKAGRDYNPYEQAIVETIIEKGQMISVDDIMKGAQDRIDKFIREEYGNLPKTVEVKVNDIPQGQTSGLFHEKFDTILKFVANNIPVFLVGEAGTGKNHTLEQVAEAMNLQFYFTNAVTQEYKLTGFIDANGTYHETEFYKAFKDGGLFFLDEMDASIPEVLIMLNASIANRYFDFPTGRINAHPDFRVVSAGNTFGNGASMEYTGRNQLDGATLDRFAVVPFTYDPAVEKELAQDMDLYSFIVGTRNAIAKKNVQFIVSMRATINARKMLETMTKLEIVEFVIFKSMPKDDIKIIINDIPNGEWRKALKEYSERGDY